MLSELDVPVPPLSSEEHEKESKETIVPKENEKSKTNKVVGSTDSSSHNEQSQMEDEIRNLRSEREAQEFMHTSLIDELQKRCERIIELEMELKIAKSTLPLPPTFQSEDLVQTSTPSSYTKARVIELELLRKEQETKITQQNEKIITLEVQVEQLQKVIQQMGAFSGGNSSVEAPEIDVNAQDLKMDALSEELGLKPMELYLLKTKPWDEKVASIVKVMEEAYEWQSWNRIDQWTSKPTLLPESLIRLWEFHREDDENDEPKMFTDESLTKCFSLEKVKLPGPCGEFASQIWEWLGGWGVDKEAPGTDSEGWMYGDFATLEFVKSPPEMQSNSNRQYHVRRRKWSRLRVLVSVPQASALTCQFLQLYRKLASMEVLCTKLSNQVLQLQTKVTDKEAEFISIPVLQKQLHGVYRRWQASKKEITNLNKKINELKNENRVLRSFASGDETVLAEIPTGPEEQGFFRRLFSRKDSANGEDETASLEPEKSTENMIGKLNQEIDEDATKKLKTQNPSEEGAEKNAVIEDQESNEETLKEGDSQNSNEETEEEKSWFKGFVSTMKDKVSNILVDEELAEGFRENGNIYPADSQIMF